MAANMLRRTLLRPLAAAPGASAPAQAQQQRAVSHFYGLLERRAKNSAGAVPQSVDIPYVDRLRAEHLLKLRMHLGHQKRKLDRGVSGALYGFRHNVAIYDVNKTWQSLRTIFYGFAEMAQVRSSFFLLAPNPHLPIKKLVDRMSKEYPFQYDKFTSLYMTGYVDKKWVDGLFSNWKNTVGFYEHISRLMREDAKGAKRFRKYARYLRGIENANLMGRVAPDFILAFATDRGATHEARNLDVPMVGMVDTNTDPKPFLYPVYGNDDSPQALEFMLDLLKRAVEEGRKREHEAFATMLVQKIKSQLDPSQVEPDTPDADDSLQREKLLAEEDVLVETAMRRRQPLKFKDGEPELPVVR